MGYRRTLRSQLVTNAQAPQSSSSQQSGPLHHSRSYPGFHAATPLNTDWIHKDDNYQPFADLLQNSYTEPEGWCISGKDWYARWTDPDPIEYTSENTRIGMMRCVPEIILGEKLPDSCVLWTKDFRLLYHGNKKAHQSRRKAKHREVWRGNRDDI